MPKEFDRMDEEIRYQATSGGMISAKKKRPVTGGFAHAKTQARQKPEKVNLGNLGINSMRVGAQG